MTRLRPHRGSLPLALLGSAVAIGLSACVTERKWRPGPARVTTAVYDDAGREVANGAAPTSGFQILGLSPRRPDPLLETQQQGLTPQEKEQRRQASIRNQFGSTVLINGDQVTKRYFMSKDTGDVFLKLIGLAAKPPATPVKIGGTGDLKSILGNMLGKEHEVSLSYIKEFENVPAMKAGPAPGTKLLVPIAATANKNSLLLVTAKAPDLAKFEDAINMFYSNIPQVEIEVKVVEFTTTESLAFGTGVVNPSGGATAAGVLTNLKSGRLIGDITSSFPLSPTTGGVSSKGLISLGGIHDGWELDATLEVLQAQGQADILSSPKLMVRNGGTAAIATTTDFPFPSATVTVTNVASTKITFRPVGITLGIKPEIAGTETVILQIHADVSAVTGFADTSPIDTPIVSKRTALTSVHVPNGKSTIIGGLRTTTNLSTETKIPILGDIPILGYLFRATTTQLNETTLSFIITPRIRVGTQDILAR